MSGDKVPDAKMLKNWRPDCTDELRIGTANCVYLFSPSLGFDGVLLSLQTTLCKQHNSKGRTNAEHLICVP